MSSVNGLGASIGLTRRRLDQRLFGPPRVVGLLQIGFGRARIPGLRHGKPKQQQACSGDAGQGQEGGAVSQADDHKATTVVDNAAPTPCAVMTAPCATLNLPVPRIRSATMIGKIAP